MSYYFGANRTNDNSIDNIFTIYREKTVVEQIFSRDFSFHVGLHTQAGDDIRGKRKEHSSTKEAENV